MDDDLNEHLPEHLAGALKKLDADAARRAAAVDPARVAERVLKRLHEEPSVTVLRPRRWMSIGMRSAAAVALLVTGGLVALKVTEGTKVTGVTGGMAVLLSDSMLADSSNHAALLAAVDEVRNVSDSVRTTTALEDLNETELRQLLTLMDTESAL